MGTELTVHSVVDTPPAPNGTTGHALTPSPQFRRERTVYLRKFVCHVYYLMKGIAPENRFVCLYYGME